MATKTSSGIWKWVAGGCGCLLLVAAGSIFALWQSWPSIQAGLKRSMEANPAYSAAVDRARAHPRVIELLGEPIESGLPTNSHFQATADGVTRTSMTVSLTGPKGEGRVEFEAAKPKDGELTFERLVVWVGGEGVDLLAGGT